MKVYPSILELMKLVKSNFRNMTFARKNIVFFRTHLYFMVMSDIKYRMEGYQGHNSNTLYA